MKMEDRIAINTHLQSIEDHMNRIREIVDNPEEPETASTECPHPEDKVIEVTTMGTLPTWKCLKCNEERNTPFYN